MNNLHWSNQTVILYVAVIICSTAAAFAAYKKEGCNETPGLYKVTIRKGWMVLSFLCLWSLLAFSTCGRDYSVYNSMFKNAMDFSYTIGRNRIEPGYAVFNYIIRIFTYKSEIYFGILAFVFLFLVYSTLYKHKNVIHFGWAVLTLSSVFFLQQMNLKRIYLAAAIVFWGMPYLIEKKYFRFFLTVLLASSIHASAILALLPLMYDIMLQKNFSKGVIILLSIALFSVIYIFRDRISFDVISERYSNYGVQNGGFGIIQLVYHIPIILVFFVYDFPKEYTRYKDIGFLCIICSLILGMMGYFIEVIGRTYVYFMYPFMLAPSLVSYKSKPGQIRCGIISYRSIVGIGLALYFAFRLYMYCSEYLILDGIMPYTNIFGHAF